MEISEEIKERAEQIEIKKAWLQSLIDQLGEELYPGLVGEEVVVYQNINEINWDNTYKVKGYDIDENHEVILYLERDGVQFYYKKEDGHKFQRINSSDRRRNSIFNN